MVHGRQVQLDVAGRGLESFLASLPEVSQQAPPLVTQHLQVPSMKPALFDHELQLSFAYDLTHVVEVSSKLTLPLKPREHEPHVLLKNVFLVLALSQGQTCE